jgi:4-hydroxythreonine-4-phosphate dehydrogenase
MPGRPHLALVPGEPAGIGPELCVRLAQRGFGCPVTVLADPQQMLDCAKALGLPLLLKTPGERCGPGELALLPFPLPEPVVPGSPDPANAAVVIDALLKAGQGCLDGEFDGLVTGPVHKAAVNAAGIAYSGTTELLAEQAGTAVVMMLANSTMRVALATTHLPLRQVAEAITPSSLERTLRILRAALQTDFRISEPRLCVLGLNPHAGEQGHLGREEIDIIVPVLEMLRSQGFDLEGPLPADTAFLPAKLAAVDAVLAMYHDQGLPVLKFAGFEQAVNITLGLPYPRVAVDHGTALDLAGKGIASTESLHQALMCCQRLAESGKRP